MSVSPAIRALAFAGCLAACLLSAPSPASAQTPRSKSAVFRTVAEGTSPEVARVQYALGAIAAVAALLGGVIWAHQQLVRRQREADARALDGALEHVSGRVRMPNLLKTGDLVEIEYHGPKTRRIYASRVQDVDGDRVTLSVPRQEGTIVPLHVGDRIGVATKSGGQSYRFLTEVLERRARPIPVLVVQRQDWVTRYQRREYYRVDVGIQARFEPFRVGGRAPKALNRPGEVVNLSGSGCRIRAPRLLGRVRYVAVQFVLPGQREEIRAICEVVARSGSRRGAAGRAEIAGRFIEIDRASRERIVRFVMAQDRRRIRRAREREISLLPDADPSRGQP